VKARPSRHLIISEASRLGREQFETGYVAKQIADHGVTMWTSERATNQNGTAKDKFMMGVSNFSSEDEREKVRDRVPGLAGQRGEAGPRDLWSSDIRYDLTRIDKHVERRIVEAEARWVVKHSSGQQTDSATVASRSAERGACPAPGSPEDGEERLDEKSRRRCWRIRCTGACSSTGGPHRRTLAAGWEAHHPDGPGEDHRDHGRRSAHRQ